ncbi:MAG: hypothetical protein ACK4S4_04010 [Pyrinomonadaceae bacterium]
MRDRSRGGVDRRRHGRWLADRLLQLTDKQISDAFRAANYSDEHLTTYTAAVKSRIRQLDEATRGVRQTVEN